MIKNVIWFSLDRFNNWVKVWIGCFNSLNVTFFQRAFSLVENSLLLLVHLIWMNVGLLTNEKKVFSTRPKVLNGIEKLIDVWHTLDKIFIFSENINFRKIKLLGWIKLASRNLLFKTISLLWNSSTMTHFHDPVAWNINTARMKWPVVSARGEFIFSAFLVRETKMWKQKQIFKKLWAVSSACESILLPRNKIDMKLDYVSIKDTNGLPYWRFKWDSTCANTNVYFVLCNDKNCNSNYNNDLSSTERGFNIR